MTPEKVGYFVEDQWRKALNVIVLFLLILSGCSSPKPSLLRVVVLTSTQTPTSAPSPTLSLTPTNTQTVIPTAPITPTFFPTLTPTPTGSNDLSHVDSSAILFEPNFKSGNSGVINFSSTYWKFVVDDQGNRSLCSIPGNYYAGLNFGESYWTNYAVELRMEELDHEAGSEATIALSTRYDPNTNTGDYGELSFENYSAKLGKPNLLFNDQSYPNLKANTWYTLRMESAGHSIKFFINNQLEGVGTDFSLSQGIANFSVSPYMEVCVDRIRVWTLTDNGEITSAQTPDPTLLARLENDPNDIYPQVWSHNSPGGQSYEFKVNCGWNYKILDTCFLWNVDQVIVTSPSGNKYSLNKDFNINTYSGEITRRWVLYGPQRGALPKNGEYTFTYFKKGEKLFVDTVSYTQSIVTLPTQVRVTQDGKDLHVTWQPPEGITNDMSYKVIVFNYATGQLAASLSFPPDSKDVILPAPPFTPGTSYSLNVAIYFKFGYAQSENVIFQWKNP